MNSFSLLHRIFLTQIWNRGLLHCRRILYQLTYQGSPNMCQYIYIYIIFFSTLFHSRLLQDIEYSSLCYTVNPSFSNISYFEMMAKEVMVKNSELSHHQYDFLSLQDPWQQLLVINQHVKRNNDPSHETGIKPLNCPSGLGTEVSKTTSIHLLPFPLIEGKYAG